MWKYKQTLSFWDDWNTSHRIETASMRKIEGLLVKDTRWRGRPVKTIEAVMRVMPLCGVTDSMQLIWGRVYEKNNLKYMAFNRVLHQWK